MDIWPSFFWDDYPMDDIQFHECLHWNPPKCPIDIFNNVIEACLGRIDYDFSFSHADLLSPLLTIIINENIEKSDERKEIQRQLPGHPGGDSEDEGNGLQILWGGPFQMAPGLLHSIQPERVGLDRGEKGQKKGPRKGLIKGRSSWEAAYFPLFFLPGTFLDLFPGEE